MTTTQRMVLSLGAAAAAAVTIAVPAAARAATIGFDDLPANTEVTTQFAFEGVLFHSAQTFLALSTPHSPPNSLVARDNFEDPDPAPLAIEFTSGQRLVSLFAGEEAGRSGTLTAFDAGGAVVAVDGPRVIAADYTTQFSVTDPASSIVHVEFALSGAGLEFIDDLTFEGAAPPPPPTPPVVTITSPPDGATVDTRATALHVVGTVSGLGIFSPGRLIVAAPGAMPFVSDVTFVATADPALFTFDALAGSSLPLGLVTLTIEATNTSGFTGRASVTVNNTTPEVSTVCGPGAPFGEIVSSASRGPSCLFAVCRAGGVGVLAGAVHPIPATIAAKASVVRDNRLGVDGTLGCPIGDAAPTVGGAILQRFERGSVYDLGALGSVFYTPTVLQSAIDAAGGQAATGLPDSDPVPGITGFPAVWWFQRFHRPDGGGSLHPTLEIRGTPPTLFIERPGGDLSELAIAELPLAAKTATIWEPPAPCAFATGGMPFPLTCSVRERVTPGPADSADLCPPFILNPVGLNPTWPAFFGDHVDTEMRGWIRAHSPDVGGATGSHLAHSDNPLNHEYTDVLPPWRSDWNFHVIPLRPFWGLLGDGANAITHNMEVEIEDHVVRFYFVEVGLPAAGDLLISAGRWVSDCAHSPRNTEIHPPSVLVDVTSDSVFGHDATRAGIHANGYWSGDEVSFDLFPPPRPTPTAHLFVSKPVGVEGVGITDESASGSFGVDTVDYDFLDTHIRPRFAAPHRDVEIRIESRMKIFRGGRNYQAVWHVGWAE